ncbi:scavenger receptor class B member 1-like [Fopius arisanus]|uniref:Scavenger receptor class B member 1-like n=1 Tax=Fopius arisanus TaxID=64838 RepID=A0A9R1TE81_9HYME|nr:PREDICTED: scavenger receptor class B member 1-like [Fopius arisanus]
MTQICRDSDRCSSYRSQKCLTASLMTMTISSIIVFVIFWCTDFFSNLIISNLVVTRNSPMLDWWVRPPIRAAYKIRIFNYTNIEDFTKGRSAKLRVQEVGPYIYRETLTRVNTIFYPNGTLSFQEKRSFQWEGGSPDDDVVVVPNIPLLTTMAFARDMNMFTQLGLTFAISTFVPQTFVSLPVGGFLWGYDDKIFDAAQPLLSLLGDIPMDKFGVLAMKKGVSKDVITMHTGEGDLSKMGMVERVNGREYRNTWGDDSCDKIYGSAGFLYPPEMYRDPKKSLDIYAVDMCRGFKLERAGEGSSYGIPTMSFKPPADDFNFSPEKDHCYCPRKSKFNHNPWDRTCPPKGIFNVSACAFDTPMLASFPHFFGGEESLFSNIEGLNPKAELHQSHLEVHPRLGLLIGGHSRIQINVEARKATGVPFLENVKDGQILPIVWIEMGIDSMPENILNLLNHAYFSVAIAEAFFQWGSIVGMIFSTSALLFLLRRNRKQHAVLKRNTSGQDKLLQESG